MNLKLFEVRDRATFIPVFAFRTRADERGSAACALLNRAGYGPWNDSPCVMVGRLEGQRCSFDPYGWGGGTRTMQVAHQYIQENFDQLEDGAVVDVEFILGETNEPKQSERFYV